MPESATIDPTTTGHSFADQWPEQQGAASDDAPDTTPESEPAKVAPQDEPAKIAAPEKPAETKPTESKVVDPAANPNLEEPAPAKPEEKKAAPADDEIPKGMTAKATETWKSLKVSEKTAVAERDAAKAELVAAKKQLEDAGKTAPDVERITKELAETKARLTEYENEIAISRVESTAHYKTQVAAPIKASEETTKALATKYEVGAAALLDAIREPDAEKRADLLSELSADFKSYDARRLFDAADAHALAQKTGEELRTNASAKLDELTKQTERQAEEERTQSAAEYRKAAIDEWKAMQTRHPKIVKKDGNDGWNSYLDALQHEVESLDVNDIPVQEVARLKVAEIALREESKVSAHFQRVNSDLIAKLAAAEARLKDYRGTEPGAGAGTTATATSKTASGASFYDVVSEPE